MVEEVEVGGETGIEEGREDFEGERGRRMERG